MKENFKINKTIGDIIQISLTIIMPCVIILVIGVFPKFELENAMEFFLKGIIIPLLLFYLSYVISIALHELGHLIMGIKNRGSLIEYNFFLFSACKENNKIKLKFKGLTSEIGGICIMDFPRDIKQLEYQKYCMGGPCVNFILFGLFLIIMILSLNNRTLLLISLYFIFVNLGLGITNLIPFETITGMETDGMKLYRMKSEKNYIDNLNKIFKIQEFLKKGGEFKNVPNDLIYKPEYVGNKSDMEMMIYYISKIIEEKKFEEAKMLIDECLNNNQNKLTAISKNNLKISLIDICLETDKLDEIKKIYDINLFKYIEMLCKFEKPISVYLYLYYIINDNKAKATNIKLELEKYYVDNNSISVKESKKVYCLINEKFTKL